MYYYNKAQQKKRRQKKTQIVYNNMKINRVSTLFRLDFYFKYFMHFRVYFIVIIQLKLFLLLIQFHVNRINKDKGYEERI